MNTMHSPTVYEPLNETQIKNGFRKQNSFFAPAFDFSSFEIPEENSCASILKEFVHLDFTEDEARFHWKGITQNAAHLQKKLKRNVNTPMAIVDYFTNITHILNAPLIIEINAFRQTERQAMVDSLTGIFNRRYMDIILKKEINRSARYKKDFSIVLLDIDNFKIVNDTRGHPFGDKVLRKLSNLLRESLREEDVLCRYGGEEFLVILPETNRDCSLTMAN
ncbi:MAG TPA: diguanylate cyclase, partial [Treponemataceae bacterium]|nr:diguanylate cyclase [Treponemataceae bacterium]